MHEHDGHHTRLVAYIPATSDRTRLDEYYPVEQPVFFTFVAFGEKPHYLRALETGIVVFQRCLSLVSTLESLGCTDGTYPCMRTGPIP